MKGWRKLIFNASLNPQFIYNRKKLEQAKKKRKKKLEEETKLFAAKYLMFIEKFIKVLDILHKRCLQGVHI